MKKLLLLLVACSTLTVGKAQPKITYQSPDQHSLVRDSAGMVYPYLVWQRLMMSHKYAMRMFKRSEADSAEYLIYKMSEQQLLIG